MAAPFRRVRPGDPGWPTAPEWDKLRAQVDGNLLRPDGLYSMCATDAAASGCTGALKEIGNPFFLGDQAGGTQTSGWLNAWSPKPSAYAVAARKPEDVVAAVNFAREHRLRLAVKGGGHSYQGTSNAPDSLLVWTRAMHVITLHDRFVPQGCDTAPVPAATIEAGAMWVDAYDAVVTKAGRYIQGGGCMSVGVAGLVQSGGFGSFSKHYGTAASSLVEASIVTADGKLRTVNDCNDPDLFWALKGGGGGSFGVITSLTLKTHDLPEFLGGASLTIKAASDQDFRRLLARFVDFYADALLNPHWGEGITFSSDNVLDISMASADLSADQARAAWQPLVDWLHAQGPAFSTSGLHVRGNPARGYWDVEGMHRAGSTNLSYDARPGASSIHAWWSDDEEEVGIFLYGYDSLWLPKSLLEKAARPKLADALFDASRADDCPASFQQRPGRRAGPSHRGGARHRHQSQSDGRLLPRHHRHRRQVRAIRACRPPMTRRRPRTAPGASPAPPPSCARSPPMPVPTCRRAISSTRIGGEHYWGTNYPRLAAIKAKYDPDGLFTVHHGVGSEAWSDDGFTRRS